MTPLKTIYIDMIGPYTVADRLGNGRILSAMTCVNPATSWLEITKNPDKSSPRTSQIIS